MDILVYPYGSLYPMDSFPFFSGDTLTHFLGRGRGCAYNRRRSV